MGAAFALTFEGAATPPSIRQRTKAHCGKLKGRATAGGIAQCHLFKI